MILLIDNYDSFSYNLYQLAGSIRPDIQVIRNDQMTVDEIEQMNPEAIILSPGPGRPADAGCCMEVAKRLGKTIPVLGICLGHQAICEAFGGEVSYAKHLMHGKQSMVTILENQDQAEAGKSLVEEDQTEESQTGERLTGEGQGRKKGRIFDGLPRPFAAARYHSLSAVEEKMPKELIITAKSEDGEIMAVEHETYPVYGLQFHPESILTPDGKKIIENFLEEIRHD